MVIDQDNHRDDELRWSFPIDNPGKYRLLAVDIDGTLLNKGMLDQADVAALHAAVRKGIIVCLCTGRSWPEARGIWEQLQLPEPHAPVICAGGALVAEPDTGRTLYSRSFTRPEAQELAEQMLHLGYPVMALVDAWREGFDYFLMGNYEQRPLYQRFLAAVKRRIRIVDRLDRDDYPRPLRLSLLEEPGKGRPIVEALKKHFDTRIVVQDIYLSHREVDIVEAFSAGTDKFTALVYLGQGFHIAPSQFAAIGDDNNDLVMLRNSALSGTPADAPEQLKQSADIILPPRGKSPVASFVEHILQKSR